MHRRGPDDHASDCARFGDREVALGHVRLAILDLSTLGRQPMASACGRFVVVFNGEIYNYVELRHSLQALGRSFSSATDTEVLVEAWAEWGAGCLPKLDGMFAFAMLDRRFQRVYLVRDGFGIKPLYWSMAPDGAISFSSQPDAAIEALGVARKANQRRALDFVQEGICDRGEDTFFEGVHQVLPGSMMTLDLADGGPPEVSTWFRLEACETGGHTLEESAEEFRGLFLRSVSRQLRSDVPLGAALSGGLDSTSVVCAIMKLQPDAQLNTFSYVVPGQSIDERKWSEFVAVRLGVRRHFVEFEEAMLQRDLDDFMRAQGEPIGGLSYFAEFCVYRLAKLNGIKVNLDGHGADEALGGYDGYPAHVLRSIRETQGLAPAIAWAYRWSRRPHNGPRLAFRRLREALHPQPSPSAGSGHREHGRRLAHRLVADLCRESCPPQLRGADRSAMWWSIENRVPFLSPDLVQFCMKQPERHLVGGDGTTKLLLRKAMRGIVPDEILDRKDKIGYAARRGLRLPVSAQLEEQLYEGFARLGFLDRETCWRAMDPARSGTVSLDGASWRVFNLLRWSVLLDVTSG
jgi:asparagine synthase (glutamine-hydrolysing)